VDRPAASLPSMRGRPDILVLGGGGVLGEAWISGVLAGLEDGAGIDLRRCEYFVGTSAGSIVAAHLAAGRSPRRPASGGSESEARDGAHGPPADGLGRGVARVAGAWALALSSPLFGPALSLAAPTGALARAALLQRLGQPTRSLSGLRRQIDDLGVSFDGRLRVVALNRATGRRVVFGRPASPAATVGQAVEASCTVPWLFAPVSIAGTEYVDGGIWSPTNLDAAPAGRGSQVLCLNPTAGLRGTHRLIAVVRNSSRSITAVEAGVLRRRGARVTLVGPDAASVTAIGPDLMAEGPGSAVIGAGYRQGLSLASAG
jgi:NTE family protein